MRISPVVQSLTEPLLSPLVSAITGVIGGGFNPRSLFNDGSIGVLYDNNDLTTMFVDASGTTPATVNGLVGLQLDKSQAQIVARRNLLTYTDQFDNAAWEKTIVGGATAPAVTPNAGVAPDGTTTADKVVFVAPVSGDISQITQTATVPAGSFTGSFYVKADGAGDIGKVIAFRHVASGPYQLITLTASWQRITKTETQFGSLFEIVLRPAVGTSSGTVSVQFWGAQLEKASSASDYQRVGNGYGDWMAGNHRYQTTTGSKPILRGTPTGAELFTAYGTPGAGWSVAGATGTATTASSALPTTTAATVGKHYRVTYTVTRSAGSVQLSFGGRTGVSRSAAGQYVEYFDNALNTNALTATGTGFTGTVRIDEVKDVSAGQVTAPYGLQYDGVDDFMVTAAVDFTATDKMFVCAGVRKLSDSSDGAIVELSVSLSAPNNGTFNIYSPGSGAVTKFEFATRGTLTSVPFTANAAYNAPYLGVITGISAIGTDTALLRINGTQVDTKANDQGTGNYGNYALYSGRRGGTSNPYNGLDFGFVIVGKTLTAAQIASTERWMAQRTGVSI